MRLFEIDNPNEDLKNEVLAWMVQRGMTDEQAKKLLQYDIESNYFDKRVEMMRNDKEAAAQKVQKLDSIFRRESEFSKAKKSEPDKITYEFIDSNTRKIFADGKEIGIIRKDQDNKWHGVINYQDKEYNIGPGSIMKLQDRIDRIVFGALI